MSSTATRIAPTSAHHHHDHDDHHDDIVHPRLIPFLLVHLACLGVFVTGVTTTGVVLCVVLYLVRMFAITAGFHRYFSHRSFKTSRVFQFVLAFLGQMSAQRGALWWAAKHREHHRHSDTPLDIHSPRHMGFFHAHVGWIFSPTKKVADYSVIPDLTRYPELVWLNRFDKLPALLLAVAVWWFAGWSGLVVGFFMSTVLLYHGTFAINSLAHVVGNQRYVTGDDSRNNWWLALITLGEGWHNNHHHFQASTRQGFRWWEIDITFYVLTALSWVGVVWDLRAPPEEVVRGERPLPRPVVEKVARQLAASFDFGALAGQMREAWAQTPGIEDLKTRTRTALAQAEAVLAELHLPEVPTLETLHQRARQARSQAEAVLAELHLPEMPSLEALEEQALHKRAQVEAVLRELQLPEVPTLDELKHRAQEMFAQTPSLDAIADRARQIILEGVSTRLLGEPLAASA